MRTKTTHKKLLALLLTLVMVLGMLPMTAFAAEGDPTPDPSITVEITDVPTSVLKTATEVKVGYKGTNTGNVPLSFNQSFVVDKNGNNVTSYSSECGMNGGAPANSWVNPEDSFDFTITYNILPADRTGGKLIRKYTQMALVISLYSGGERITCEALPVTVEIPLEDPAPAISVAPDPSLPATLPNTTTQIAVEYTITNTGNVPVSCNSYYVQERNDTTHIAPGDATYSVVMPYDDWSWVNPGASFVTTVTYKVQEADVAAGNLKRAFTCIAHGIEIEGGGGECSDTAIIELPLVDPEPELQQIEAVEVSNVTAPIAGATASFDFAVPTDADYSKQDRGSGITGAWAVFNTAPTAADIETAAWITDSFSFVGGKYYVFAAYLKANEGFFFSTEDIPATMNGAPADYDWIISASANVIGTFYCTSSEVDAGSLEDAYITITPEDPTVERGGSLALGAEVTGLEDKSVTWALGYTYAEGTAIDQNGVLTVAEDETATRIAVSAKANGTLPTEDISSYFWVYVIDPTTPETETVLIPLRKNVAGEGAPAEEFSFSVVDGNSQPFTDPNGEGPAITGNTIRTEGVGSYSGLITITGTPEEIAAVKQLGINITENSKSGWDCDETEYIMRWHDENNRWYMFDTTGLTVIRTFEDYGDPLDQLEFTNTYVGEDDDTGEGGSPSSVECTVNVTKVVEGENAPNDAVFTFMLLNENVDVVDTTTITGAGNGSFKPLSFTEPGTYVYMVKEVEDGTGAWEYDSKTVTVTVQVSMGTDGLKIDSILYNDGTTISGSITIENPDGLTPTINNPGNVPQLASATFTNTYLGNDDDDTGEDTTEEYNIEVILGKATVGAGTEIFKAAANTGITITADALEGKEFVKWVMTVGEVVLANETSSSTTFTMPAHDVVIEATYKDAPATPGEGDQPAPVEYSVPVTKHIEGDNAPADAVFTFELSDGDNSTTVQITGEGTARFVPLRFTEEGTYYYTVEEQNGGLTGWTYDDSIVSVAIEVLAAEDSNAKPILKIESVIYTVGNNRVDGANFTNIYDADAEGGQPGEDDETKPVEYIIAVAKIVETTGAAPANTQFTFQLSAGAGTLVDTASITGAGTVNFKKLSFDKPGDYVYTVSEVNGGVSGWTYDSNAVTVTIHVALSEVGLFIPSVEYAKGGASATGVSFTNTYTGGGVDEPSEPVKISIPIQKIVTKGGNVTPEARTFQFELFNFGTGSLSAADLKITGNTIATNGAGTYNGTIVITVDSEDVFGDLTEGFYIRETKGSAANWIYSDAVYHVSYDGEKWVVTKTNENGAAVSTASFTNKYTKNSYYDPKSPKTGDDSRLGLWLCLTILGVFGVGSCVALPKLKKRGRYSK